MPYNDFSFLTDSEDEKTVDDIISQATDHLVLEQIAKLNSSSFDDSLLPSNLETRFRKLKSLPTVTTRAANSTSRAVNPLVKSKSFTPSLGNESVDEVRGKSVKKSKDENLLSKVLESKVKKLKELETKVKTITKTSLSESRSGSSLSGSDSEKSDSDKTKSDSETDKKKRNLKSKSFRTESVSDMWRKFGCLFCSPKKGKKPGNGKGKENRLSFSSLGNYDEDEDYMKSFSAKERKKLMKKAMKEEEKLNKEAEKIVKWAKQASDRMMNVSGLNLDEDLSDFDKCIIHTVIIDPHGIREVKLNSDQNWSNVILLLIPIRSYDLDLAKAKTIPSGIAILTALIVRNAKERDVVTTGKILIVCSLADIWSRERRTLGNLILRCSIHTVIIDPHGIRVILWNAAERDVVPPGFVCPDAEIVSLEVVEIVVPEVGRIDDGHSFNNQRRISL
ncbi:hypothetical protein Tco_0900134 [Tanacetum coccineum]